MEIKSKLHLDKHKDKQNAAIQQSSATNKHGLSLIARKQETVAPVKEEVVKVLKSSVNVDKELLATLIVEGLLLFLESEVEVRCMEGDEANVRGAFESAKQKYCVLASKKREH